MVTDITVSSIRTLPQQGSSSTQAEPVKLANENSSDTSFVEEKNFVEEKLPSNVTELTADQSEKVEENVSRLNEIVQTIQRDLQFSVDDDSGRTVVTVLDSKTQEVIRQIPTEQVLALSENIENLKGILFSAEV